MSCWDVVVDRNWPKNGPKMAISAEIILPCSRRGQNPFFGHFLRPKWGLYQAISICCAGNCGIACESCPHSLNTSYWRLVSNPPLTPILLKSIAVHLPFLSQYFCKSVPRSRQQVVYTLGPANSYIIKWLSDRDPREPRQLKP